MFDFLGQVFLSSGNIPLPSLSVINSFTNNPKVSALFPSFSGYPIPSKYFYASDKNHTYVTVPSFDVTGTYDIILYNVAGYSKLSSQGYLLSCIASQSLSGLLTISGGLMVTIQDPLSEITLINH
jgi:hypothetical protein